MVSEPNAYEEHEQANESEQLVATGSWWDYFDREREKRDEQMHGRLA